MNKAIITAFFTVFSLWVAAAGAVTTNITDVVDGDGWEVPFGRGADMEETLMSPTAGSSYYGVVIEGGKLRNRAAAKDFGIILEPGYTYTVTADFNVADTNVSFIADAFSTITSEQVAFGLFLTNGVDFTSDYNSEREKIMTGINDILGDAETSVSWVSNTIPDGSSEWQTWSYTFTISESSPYAGEAVWFGIYGGQTTTTDPDGSLAFDNLNIAVEQIVDPVTTITDVVDGDGWEVPFGRGADMEQTLMGPTAGSSYYGVVIEGGKLRNRAAAKDFGIILEPGYAYTVTADFNVADTNVSFIADAFNTITSEQVAFGLFLTNGVDFTSDYNSEREKIMTGINDILGDAETSVSWVSNTIPDGSGEWQTWSYTFTITESSPYAGEAVWFGIYGGQTTTTDPDGSLAFDNLNITVQPVSEPLVIGLLNVTGDQIVFCLDAVDGVSYAIQSTTNLVTGSWSNVVEGIVGNGTVCITNDIQYLQAFYQAVYE